MEKYAYNINSIQIQVSSTHSNKKYAMSQPNQQANQQAIFQAGCEDG